MRRGQILNVTGLFHGYRYFLKTKPLATCSVSFNLQNNNKPRLMRRGQILKATCSVSFNLQNNNKPSLMRRGQILNVTGLFHD